MKKISSLIGASVCSIHSGQNLGYVYSFTLNKSRQKISSILVADDELDTVYSIPTHKIFAFDSLVLIKNSTALSVVADSYPKTILNAQVIDIFGSSLGAITDLTFDEKFRIQSIITTTSSVLPSQIINFAHNLVFVNKSDTHLSLSYFAPSKKSLVLFSNADVHALSSVSTPKTIEAKSSPQNQMF